MNYELGIKNQRLSWLRRKTNSLIPYSLFLIPLVTHAQPSSPLDPQLLTEILDIGRQAAGVGLGKAALYDLDLRLFVMRIVTQLLGVVGVIFIAYLVWGGALWMTAAGAEEKIKKANQILIHATVGVVIILLSYSATRFVAREVIRALQASALTQVQSCTSSGGNATCCPELTAYQSGTTNLKEFGGCLGDGQDQCLKDRYKKWTDCMAKESKRVEKSAKSLWCNVSPTC